MIKDSRLSKVDCSPELKNIVAYFSIPKITYKGSFETLQILYPHLLLKILEFLSIYFQSGKTKAETILIYFISF